MQEYYQYRIKKNTKISDKIFILDLIAADKTKTMPKFKPGQWAALALYDDKRGEWDNRPFSIASSPQQTDKLQFAIKTRASFTQRAKLLGPGEPVRVIGPFGEFYFDEIKMPRIALLAGGIGITPMMSILRHIAVKKLNNPATLFYSAQTKAELVYFSTIKRLAQNHENIQPYFTLTREKSSKWAGEIGRFTIERIQQQVKNWTSTHFLICGSNDFVKAMETQLLANRVSPACIIKEKFY